MNSVPSRRLGPAARHLAVAIAVVGCAWAAEPPPRFAPLDLAPLVNQPHAEAFPEAPDGFRGWFDAPEFTRTRTDGAFAVTPWDPAYATPRTPPDFGAWAQASGFGPETHSTVTEVRIPFRVLLTGPDVVAFDRHTVPLAKRLSGVNRRADRVHLLACAGWYPSGPMGLNVVYADGTREEAGFQTHEWLAGAADLAIAFEHGNLFHHVVPLSHPDKVIDSLELVDTQDGPQLLVAAVTLESGPAPVAPAAGPGPEAKAAWQRLADSVVRFDQAAIVVTAGTPPLVTFAGRELQRYLWRLSGHLLPVAATAPADRPAVRLGVDPALTGDAFRLRCVGPRELRIDGAAPPAVLYGAYALLEKLGVGFTLGGDLLPPRPVPFLVPGDLDLRVAPVFAIRGTLPWYNFLNSPTTWNPDDFRFFVDQMVKQKNNFVGFHTYDSEPFAPVEIDGQLRCAEPLVGAAGYGWGTVRPLKTAEFGFGTAGCFDSDDFAAAATLGEGDRATRIRRCQALLRQGLEYARSKGMKTCVGFEVTADPTDPEEQQRFGQRLLALLEAYPTLDYVWIWQSEGLGGQGWSVPAPESALATLTRDLFPTLAYLGTRERVVDAARLAAYAALAHRLLAAARPGVRLVVAGWDGDRWMHFADHFVGLDRVLPPDVVFAALDNIDPTAAATVSRNYAQVRAHEFWPIPWFESDGGGTRRDQWGPQCNVSPFVALCRDAQAKKATGLLAIHWRTRGVEEVAAYSAQFAWDPGLGYAEFYHGFAKRAFGGERAAEAGALLRDLEALGPRWTGGGGQVECGTFSWFEGNQLPREPNLARLAEIGGRFAQWRQEAIVGKQAGVVDRIDHLLSTIRWLTLYDQAAALYRAGGPVEALLAEGRKAEALEILRQPRLGQAMQAYARTLTTRSELGVLATINVKAYAAYLGLLERAGADSAPALPWPPGPPLLLHPAYTSTYDVGETVTLRAVAIDDQDTPAVRAWFRPLGAAEFASVEMQPVFRRTLAASLPGVTTQEGGFEYYLEATGADGERSRLPFAAPAALFSATVRQPLPAPALPAVPTADVLARVLAPAEVARLFQGLKPSGGPAAPTPAAAAAPTAAAQANAVRLSWAPVADAVGYHVWRRPAGAGAFASVTAACPVPATAWVDGGVEVEQPYEYTVRAVGADGAEGPASPAVSCTAAYAPPSAVSLAPGQVVQLALRCAVRGPSGFIRPFDSLDRDRVVLRRGPTGVRKLQGFGYCWDPDQIGCWAGDEVMQFALTGLQPGRRYRLWLRCLSWEGMPRTLQVSVGGEVCIDGWELERGRGVPGGWREVPLTAAAAEVPVEVRKSSGANAVVSEIILVQAPE